MLHNENGSVSQLHARLSEKTCMFCADGILQLRTSFHTVVSRDMRDQYLLFLQAVVK
jgi:hypothetical protein